MYKSDMILIISMILLSAIYDAHSSSPINTQEESFINFNTKNIANGEYNFNFFTPDETQREESGSFVGEDNYVVTGSYSYIDSLGNKHTVRYTADKNGFHPTIEDDDSEDELLSAPPQIVAALLG